MKGYIIDVENGRYGTVNIGEETSHLKQFYDLIGCDCIDITVRKVGNSYYNVVLDDEGLLKDRPTISAIDYTGRGMLAGNLLLFGMDREDMDLTDLTDEDVSNIWGCVVNIVDFDAGKCHPAVLMEC